MKKYPLVSVVTLNYNKAEVTRALLISLKCITYPAIEIIVVDNASADRSIEEVVNVFPEIKLINSETNLGFAGGNNLGMRAAKGELILLINNDVEVPPRFLEPMVDVFLFKGNAGMVSPKIIYFHNRHLIQYAGSNGISPWTGRGKKNGNLKTDEGQYNYICETSLVHGACVMVSRKLVDDIGMLDESYFIYYEEHDWAERAKAKGYTLYYVGTSTIYHKESVTTGKESPFKTYYMTKNRLLFLRRNVTYPAFLVSLMIFVFLAVPKKIFIFILQFNLTNLNALLRGILWHVGLRSKFA